MQTPSHNDVPDQVAHLIERNGLCLGFCDRKFSWITFTNESALRFSRHSDTVRFIEAMRDSMDLENVLVTEHLWNARPVAEGQSGPHICSEAYGMTKEQCPACIAASPPSRRKAMQELNAMQKKLAEYELSAIYDDAGTPPRKTAEEVRHLSLRLRIFIFVSAGLISLALFLYGLGWVLKKAGL